MDVPPSGPQLGVHEIPAEIREGLSSEQRELARRCLTAMAVLGGLGLAGTASSLYLANNAPLLLIAMSPIGRHLILVAPIVDPVAFVLVGVVRRMLFYTAAFHLGRAMGPAGIVWIESRSERIGRFVRWVERIFERWSHAVVFFAPGPTVATLAGISDMRGRVFAGLATAGLTFRMLVILAVAEYLREPIVAVLAYIDRHWIPGTILLVTGIALYQWYARRRELARQEATASAPQES